MKKMAFRIVAALGLLLAISAVASAQSALPGSGWYTPTTIQNVSSTTGNADVTLQVYQSGTEATASQVQFQLAQGLIPDGRAGPMTFMQLNRAAGLAEPRLRPAADAIASAGK